MDRKLKISLIIIAGVLGFAYAAFLFIVPALINPENYSGDIKTAVKEACGLEIEPGTLKVRTYPDLSAGVTAENTQLFIPGNEQPSLKVGKAGVKVKLLPLLFKRLEFAEVYVNNPEISVIKLKNGKYDIENAIKIPEQDKVEDEIAAQKKNESDIKLVFDGIDIIVRDYKVNLTDKSGAKAQTAGLKGELIRISEFQPDKFIKIATKGEFLVGQEPRITYDIKFSNETSPEMSTEEALPEEDTQAGSFDPLEGIMKYNLKADIKADLKLKNGKNPKDSGYIKGFLDFDKLSFTIDGKPLPDSYGKFKFAGKKLDIDSKLFITPSSFIAITGNVNDIDKQDIDLNVKSSDINLNDIKRFAYSLADAVKADTKVLNDIGLAGSLKADFNVKKNNYQGYLSLKNVQISHKELSQPLKNLNSNVQFGKNKIVFENTAGYLGDIRFDVVGDISQKLVADVKVLAPAVNCATVYGIVNNSKLFADLKPQLKDINSVSGLVNAEVHIKGDLNKEVLPQIKLTPDNVRAYYVPSKLPVSIVSGTITTDTKNTKLKSLSLKVSESPVKVKGEISDKKGVQDINITIDGKILNSDVAKYLPADVKKSLKANANIPFDAVISGKPDDLNVSTQIDVDNLTPGLAINHPKGTSIIASINANVKPKVVSFKNSGLFTATNTLKTKDGRYDLTSVPKLVVLEGGISGIDTSNPTLNNIKADISGLDISLLEPKGKLQINGNLVITGKSISPNATGTLSVRNIDIPSMQLTGKTVDLALKESEILANIDLIDIAGSKFAANAALNNNLALPLQVKSAKVTSEFADLDKLSAVMQAAAVQTSSPKTKKKGNSVGVSHSASPQDVPVLIKSGTFTAKKLITAGFPVENVSCEFFIDRINELKVRNIKGSTFGGAVAGVADTNLKTTKLNMDVTVDNVEMNEMATTMAKMPNEIYGKAKARVVLETIGQTPEETMQNAVGKVNFEVKNGRLVKLGSIEYLLGAGNLSVKGLSQSLLSKTLGFAEAEQTNQFDTLSGIVNINKGTLDIQEIRMQGRYLSSFATGTVRMKDNNTDLTLLNRLSGKITKRLGPVAEISGISLSQAVDELAKKIPGQWGQLIAEQIKPVTGSTGGNAAKYPNRDKIPALSSATLPEDRDFVVKIKGKLNNPTSIKSFEWLPVVAPQQ